MKYYVIQELIKGEIFKYFSFYEFITKVKEMTLKEIPITITYVE